MYIFMVTTKEDCNSSSKISNESSVQVLSFRIYFILYIYVNVYVYIICITKKSTVGLFLNEIIIPNYDYRCLSDL